MREHIQGSDVVADPVGHISISGVHGRKELDMRLQRARPYAIPGRERSDAVKALLAGAAIGAIIMFLFKR